MLSAYRGIVGGSVQMSVHYASIMKLKLPTGTRQQSITRRRVLKCARSTVGTVMDIHVSTMISRGSCSWSPKVQVKGVVPPQSFGRF